MQINRDRSEDREETDCHDNAVSESIRHLLGNGCAATGVHSVCAEQSKSNYQDSPREPQLRPVLSGLCDDYCCNHSYREGEERRDKDIHSRSQRSCAFARLIINREVVWVMLGSATAVVMKDFYSQSMLIMKNMRNDDCM